MFLKSMMFSGARLFFWIFIAVTAATIPGRSLADSVSDTNWIDLLYADTLGRSPSGQELNTRQTELSMGTPRTAIALDIVESQEFDTITVQDAFQLYLHRAADSSSLNTFVMQLQQGTRDEDVFGSLIASPEYFMNRASNDNGLFVNAIYQDVLDRIPSALEVSTGITAIQNTSRAAYTNSILTSTEARGVFVGDWFQLYLDRSATTMEKNTFVGEIGGGATFDQVRSQILGSSEFYNLAQQVPEPHSTMLICLGGLLVTFGVWRRAKHG